MGLVGDSMGIFSWFKWTKLILSAEQKFIDIYNFEVSIEYKIYSKILPLAFCIIFEEMRLNKVQPNNVESILEALRKDSPFYQYVSPNGSDFVNWEAYKMIYTYFVSYRASGERPIVAIVFAMNSQNASTDDELQGFKSDYEQRLYFGNNV